MEAKKLASIESPRIVELGFKERAALYEISSAGAELRPKLTLDLSAEQSWDPNTFFEEYEKYHIGANLSIPLYQGGYKHSNIRQKRQLAIQKKKQKVDTVREILKSVEISWRFLKNAEAQIKAFKSTVKANEIALQGVQEESVVGTRTTLDVLDAEQELLESRINLINAEQDLHIASYKLLKDIGLLNVRELNLKVEKYDPENNYKKIKKIWIGIQNNG